MLTHRASSVNAALDRVSWPPSFLDTKEDRDDGYVVEAFIPWKSFDKAKKTPPAVGDTWRINVYAMRDGRGVGWSPILGKGNLHNAARFGQVLWAEKGYVEPAAPAASAEAKPANGDSAPSPDSQTPARTKVPIGAK